MPWDTQTKTLTIYDATGNDRTVITVQKLGAEKFPLIFGTVTENTDRTFSIITKFGMNEDGPFTALTSNTGMVTGNTYGIVDLSTVSGKPAGAPYLQITFTSTAPLEGAEIGTAVITTSTWVDALHGGVSTV